jgi:hypothetical protein
VCISRISRLFLLLLPVPRIFFCHLWCASHLESQFMEMRGDNGTRTLAAPCI